MFVFLNSRFTIEVGLNYTQMKDSPVQKCLKKLSQQMEKCKFDLFLEQRSLPGDFQLFSQPIVLNWKLEKVCITMRWTRLRRAVLSFYTFAGLCVIYCIVASRSKSQLVTPHVTNWIKFMGGQKIKVVGMSWKVTWQTHHMFVKSLSSESFYLHK